VIVARSQWRGGGGNDPAFEKRPKVGPWGGGEGKGRSWGGPRWGRVVTWRCGSGSGVRGAKWQAWRSSRTRVGRGTVEGKQQQSCEEGDGGGNRGSGHCLGNANCSSVIECILSVFCIHVHVFICVQCISSSAASVFQCICCVEYAKGTWYLKMEVKR
jgi:hypothetical protein